MTQIVTTSARPDLQNSLSSQTLAEVYRIALCYSRYLTNSHGPPLQINFDVADETVKNYVDYILKGNSSPINKLTPWVCAVANNAYADIASKKLKIALRCDLDEIPSSEQALSCEGQIEVPLRYIRLEQIRAVADRVLKPKHREFLDLCLAAETIRGLAKKIGDTPFGVRRKIRVLANKIRKGIGLD